MKWNYLLGACVLAVLYSVLSDSPIPAVVSGIVLAATIKIGGIKLIARMQRKR